MKKHFGVIAIAVAALAMSACTVQERVVVHEPPHVVIRHMPPPVQEVVYAAPGPGYTWVAGHWAWMGNEWQWQAGHWYQGHVRPMPPVIVEEVTVAPGAAYFWVPGHWHWHGSDWEWQRGHWAR